MNPEVSFFTGNGPESDEKVTDQSERQIVNWLIGTPQPRELLLGELMLSANTYVQTAIIEPLVEKNRRQPPGDIDLIFVPDAHRAIAIQVKRFPVIAETAYKDHTTRGQLGDITKLVEQANGSREIGFWTTYALVLVECYGPARQEYNFASRDSSPGVFSRIYHMTKERPIHRDVGLIFVEITQPTRASVDRAATVCVHVDKPAIPVEQSSEITARVRQLMANKISL